MQFFFNGRAWRVGLATGLLLLGGCASVDRTVALAEQSVTAIGTGEAADVGPDALAAAMLQAGFSRKEILDHGPTLRNALATTGSAQVRNGNEVSAIFAVYGDQLYVTSRLRGTFVQQL